MIMKENNRADCLTHIPNSVFNVWLYKLAWCLCGFKTKIIAICIINLNGFASKQIFVNLQPHDWYVERGMINFFACRWIKSETMVSNGEQFMKSGLILFIFMPRSNNLMTMFSVSKFIKRSIVDSHDFFPLFHNYYYVINYVMIVQNGYT
jgi:hypothetical protein